MEERETDLVGVGPKAKVLHRLASVLRSTEEQSVRTSRSTQRKLVQGQALTPCFLDSGSGGGGKAKGSDRQFGDVQEAIVVGDSANNNNGLALVRVSHVRDDPGKRNRWAVDSGHKKTAQHDFVEIGISAACRGDSNQHSVPKFKYTSRSDMGF